MELLKAITKAVQTSLENLDVTITTLGPDLDTEVVGAHPSTPTDTNTLTSNCSDGSSDGINDSSSRSALGGGGSGGGSGSGDDEE